MGGSRLVLLHTTPQTLVIKSYPRPTSRTSPRKSQGRKTHHFGDTSVAKRWTEPKPSGATYQREGQALLAPPVGIRIRIFDKIHRLEVTAHRRNQTRAALQNLLSRERLNEILIVRSLLASRRSAESSRTTLAALRRAVPKFDALKEQRREPEFKLQQLSKQSSKTVV